LKAVFIEEKQVEKKNEEGEGFWHLLIGIYGHLL
jgi:hypothetical protein